MGGACLSSRNTIDGVGLYQRKGMGAHGPRETITTIATCTKSTRVGPCPALVICPRSCVSPELFSTAPGLVRQRSFCRAAQSQRDARGDSG